MVIKDIQSQSQRDTIRRNNKKDKTQLTERLTTGGMVAGDRTSHYTKHPTWHGSGRIWVLVIGTRNDLRYSGKSLYQPSYRGSLDSSRQVL